MLHRDDNWALDPFEEEIRWEIINKYEPQMICRSPRRRMVTEWGDSLYSEEIEIFFREKLKEYRNQ